jgi:hypothetical protein
MISQSLPSRWSFAGLLTAAIGLSLSGCAARSAAGSPAAPTVLALPAKGENIALFQQHDTTCRHYASAQIGGQTPGEAGAKTGITGAVLGTGVGAAVGALLGSASGHAGGGAAIGAGSGLLAGGLLGSAAGRNAATATQNQYNDAYTQCMIGSGEQVVPPAAPPVVYVAPPPVVYAPPPSVVYVAPPLYAAPLPPRP